MIKNLNIKNFRIFNDFKVEDCNKINIFIGANGTGKTTILDFIDQTTDLKKTIFINNIIENFKKYGLIKNSLSKKDILLVDEIENGLHFTLYKILWQSILDFVKKKDKQVFVTTHSYEIIKSLFKKDPKMQYFNLYSLDNWRNKPTIHKFDLNELSVMIKYDKEIRH